MDTFKKAIEFANATGDGEIILSGGEPTLHPKFMDMVGYTLCHFDFQEEFKLLIVTNGTNKDISLRLERMTKCGILDAVLSYDDFHDTRMVDNEVYHAFNELRESGGYEGIREIRILWAQGRAADPARGIAGAREGCACRGWTVNPNGNIFPCGCEDAPVLGNVRDGGVPFVHEEFCSYECCHEQEEEVLQVLFPEKELVLQAQSES
jgi:MoaA/NifB/PqqE/SkfB family radical SAM enzyme